ncbi:MAG TPA: STELLO glycosyltransferase family protein [Candidatus Saccharimonadales bacterium]|nr:STELLO glycosyltransferase family protein [Candidatus Saccharimonadales bacterium]
MADTPKNYLIITSIFEPTEAVKKFAKISDWHLVVVGDKKTPADWQYEGVTYLGPETQEATGFEMVKHLPWNHYCRKMIGYLYAMQQGAERIADTDDDNEPLEGWPNLPAGGAKLLSGAKFANIYEYYTDHKVWPRGYPLNLLLDGQKPTEGEADDEPAIWQFLANEDPDVDAIYRLIDNTPIYFNDGGHYVLNKGTVCPFNSQNTIFGKEVFPLLYLPAFVTFRFTDILRGLVAQPVLWGQDKRLGFGPATVIQKRNPHNYLRDFESEVPVYLNAEKVIDVANEALAAAKGQPLTDQLLAVYTALRTADIVTDDELTLLRAWIADCKKLGVA